MSNTRPEQGRLLAAIGPGAYADLMALWAQVAIVDADDVRAIRAAYVAKRRRAALAMMMRKRGGGRMSTLHDDGICDEQDGLLHRAILVGPEEPGGGFTVLAVVAGKPPVIMPLTHQEAAHLARVLLQAAGEEAGR